MARRRLPRERGRDRERKRRAGGLEARERGLLSGCRVFQKHRPGKMEGRNHRRNTKFRTEASSRRREPCALSVPAPGLRVRHVSGELQQVDSGKPQSSRIDGHQSFAPNT